MTQTLSISIIIHTLNEEKNLPFALESLKGRFSEIFVVDAGSSDGTEDVCSRYDVQFIKIQDFLKIQGDRSTLVEQRNWALENLKFSYDWVYIVDADEQMTAELYDELKGVMADGGPPESIDGYLVRYKEIILGRWIKRAGFYPNWGIRLIRHNAVRHESRSVNSHLKVDPERTERLSTHFIHDDKRGFHAYIKRLGSVSTIEAETIDEIYVDKADQIKGSFISSNPLERRRALKKLFNRLPGRPLIAFLYLYGFRMGFLEGWPGFYAAYLRMTHEIFVSALKYDARIKDTNDND